VARGYLPRLLFLSSLWGASYLFIKVAVLEMEPAAVMSLRLLLAAAVLVGVLVLRMGWRPAVAALRATGRHGVVLGVINGAVPFWLIAWGETHIDSGIAAIANSTLPIFVALLAVRLRPSERPSGLRLGGILVGLAGVAVLSGLHPDGGGWAVAGTLAVVLASLFYARASLYTQEHFAKTPPLVTATAALLIGAIVILPFGLLQLPEELPSWKALGSIAALSVGGTAIGSLVLYRMLTTYGSSRTTLVNYLLPVFALFYGAVLLDEPLTAHALGGLVLILAGVALGSGLVRLTRRRGAVPAALEP
jgi:drug/metabolite transporter (DMT)-like permease